MSRTTEEWEAAVQAKIDEVLADTSTTNYAPEISTADKDFALTIDHTLLKPDATPDQVDKLCDEAVKYSFKSCCVNGANVKQVADRLNDSGCVPCVVVGFPLGAMTSQAKAWETEDACKNGAKEIDMVINISLLKSKQYAAYYDDIHAVVKAASNHAIVKVIIETVFLSAEEKIAGSFIAAEAGAKFVKTCTGFSGGAASAADVRLMKKTIAYKQGVKVKASAGVRTFEKCLEMLQAGAARIGTSSGTAIMEESEVQAGTY
ncbi:hypothetical protein DFP73DRAFT_511390 [Morchella snyderi]|nr:hypothetical protein DFP73DRAFT_511390 [Morchella snyderi]